MLIIHTIVNVLTPMSPPSPPPGSFGLNEAAYNGGTAASHVADDGCLHVVADRAKLREALQMLDLQRARVLTKVGVCWGLPLGGCV
jgi:hypothetical protein